MTPSMPAALARCRNSRVPIASIGLAYPISTIGVALSVLRNSATMRSTSASPTPCFSARSPERWITGPSAIGSENGTPSSRMSEPASTRPRMSGTVSEGCGSPAVMYGMSALRLLFPSASKRHRMRRLERRDDALAAAKRVEGGERLVVGHGDVLGTAVVLEPCVLGADARIVETRRDRMRLGDLSVRVLQQVGAVAVQHARLARAERCGVPAALQSFPGGFDTDQAHALVRQVGVKDAHGVGAAADAGDHGVGLPLGHLLHLHDALLADDGLEVPHHHRIGMRAGHRADDEEGEESIVQM